MKVARNGALRGINWVSDHAEGACETAIWIISSFSCWCLEGSRAVPRRGR